MNSDTVVVVDPFVSKKEGEESAHGFLDLQLKCKKGNITQEAKSIIKKSVSTSFIEAATEYCRILFDLFPPPDVVSKSLKKDCPHVAMVIPYSSKEPPQSTLPASQQWKGTPQNIRGLLEWISSHDINQSDKLLLTSLKNGIELICSRAQSSSGRSKRIVALYHRNNITDDIPCYCIEGESGKVDLVQYVSDTLTEIEKGKRKKERETIELTLICTTNSKVTEVIQQSFNKGNVIGTVYLISIHSILKTVQDIACIHFRLRSIRITDIPMKTEGQERITYDVHLLHPANEHHLSSDLVNRNIVSLSSVQENEITLQWQVDKSIIKTALACECIHRLTPVSVYSNPTQCLTRYLIGQKPVTLVYIPKDGESNKKISHFIALQGKQMYLHCLRPSFSLPSKELGTGRILDFYSSPVDTSLRTNAFANIVTTSKLQPYPSQKGKLDLIPCSLPGESHTVVTSPNIVEKTMWFPYHQNSTILCQQNASGELNQMLTTLYKYFSKTEQLTLSEISKGKSILQKLYKGWQTNNVALFPDTNPNNRENLYKLLWNELVTLSTRSKKYYGDNKSSKLSSYIDSLFDPEEKTEEVEEQKSDAMEIDNTLETRNIRKSSPTRSGSNSGDLTHSGATLEEERKRRNFTQRPNPFDSVDNQSLFSTFWNSKLSKIPASKNVL